MRETLSLLLFFLTALAALGGVGRASRRHHRGKFLLVRLGDSGSLSSSSSASESWSRESGGSSASGEQLREKVMVQGMRPVIQTAPIFRSLVPNAAPILSPAVPLVAPAALPPYPGYPQPMPPPPKGLGANGSKKQPVEPEGSGSEEKDEQFGSRTSTNLKEPRGGPAKSKGRMPPAPPNLPRRINKKTELMSIDVGPESPPKELSKSETLVDFDKPFEGRPEFREDRPPRFRKDDFGGPRAPPPRFPPKGPPPPPPPKERRPGRDESEGGPPRGRPPPGAYFRGNAFDNFPDPF